VGRAKNHSMEDAEREGEHHFTPGKGGTGGNKSMSAQGNCSLQKRKEDLDDGISKTGERAESG